MIKKNLHLLKISCWWVTSILDSKGRAGLVSKVKESCFCVLSILFLICALHTLFLKDCSCSCMRSFHLLGYVFFWSNKKIDHSFYLLLLITRSESLSCRSKWFLSWWLNHLLLMIFFLFGSDKFTETSSFTPCHEFKIFFIFFYSLFITVRIGIFLVFWAHYSLPVIFFVDLDKTALIIIKIVRFWSNSFILFIFLIDLFEIIYLVDFIHYQSSTSFSRNNYTFVRIVIGFIMVLLWLHLGRICT